MLRTYICFDKKNQGVIYAAGVAGGIFKSTNAGATWSPINDQLTNMIVSCMSQDASGNYIYFGTGEDPSGNYTFVGKGLFKLELATNIVTSIPSSTSFTFINDIICHKTDANTLFMGTRSNGFKISNDAGATWHPAKLATTSVNVATSGNISDVKVASDGSYVFYAGTKLYISQNADDFVADITPTVVISSSRSSVEIAIAPSNTSIMYLSCVNNSGGGSMGAVVQSIDKGLTWTKMTTPIPDPFNPSGFSAQGFYDNVISVDPKNPYRIFLGGVAFWNWVGNSSAQGTWTQAGYQFNYSSPLYVHSDLHAMEWDPFNNNTLIVGGDGGLTRTTNNATSFTTINKGFNVTQAYAIAYQRYPVGGFGGIPVGGAMCGNQDNGTTYVSGIYNGTKGALPVGGGDGNYCDFSHVSPSVLFTSIYYGQVDRASNPGFLNGTSFYDAEYSNFGGNSPGSGFNFASFVTPISLWETDNDYTSIDTVYFKAKSVNNIVGSANGVSKTFLTKMTKSNSSAVFETLKLTLGTGATSTVSLNYTAPPANTYTQNITIGTVTVNVTRREYFTTLSSISTTVVATSFVGNPDYDSLRIKFNTAPSNGLTVRAELSQKYLSGSYVRVSSESSQELTFGYNLTANLASLDSVKVPDIVQSRLAVGISGAVYVVKRPLSFGVTPDWVQVAGPKSLDETNTASPFSGTVNFMTWSSNGNHLYVGTSSGNVYRVSHLHYLIDSVGNATSLPAVDAKYNGINTTGGNANPITPIRCTRIGNFSGSPITSIAISPDTIGGEAIVVTTGVYNTNPKVYYATNPSTLIASSSTSNFVSKMGIGATGLVSGSPVYSSIIELVDNKRVLVGTEYGLYGTSDITVTNPIWSKENNNMLPNVPVTALRQQTRSSLECYNSGMIYAGTHGRGMWTTNNYYSQTAVGVNEITPKDKTTVSSIKLYPNPAHDNVNLSFNIEKSESLTLNIYDLKGNLVMTKYLGKLPEGEQLMQIGTEDLISGNYIVSLSSSNAIVGTNRLVVVK